MKVALCLRGHRPCRAFRSQQRRASGPSHTAVRTSSLQWEQNRALAAAVRRGEPVYCGGGNANVVALTFDDGPGPYTEQLVSLLRDAGAHATFFVIGNRLRYWPAAPREESQVGAVGNHTWSHPRLTLLPTWLVWAELAAHAVRDVAGARLEAAALPAPVRAAQRRGPTRRALARAGAGALVGDFGRRPEAPDGEVGRAQCDPLNCGPARSCSCTTSIRGRSPRCRRSSTAISARGLRAVSIPELLVLDPPAAAPALRVRARGSTSCATKALQLR